MFGIKEIGTLVRVGTGEIVYDVQQRTRSDRTIYFSGHDGRGKRIIINATAMAQYARGILIGHKWLSPVDNFQYEILAAIQRPGGLSATVTVEVTKLADNPDGDPYWKQPGVGVRHTERGTWQGIVVQEDLARMAAPAEDVE